MKKKGSLKPRKKETIAAAKKGGKGTKAAGLTRSPTPPLEEVVAEGGMSTAEGRREAPAASSAGQVAPAAGQEHDATAAGTAAPASAAGQQGQLPFSVYNILQCARRLFTSD